MKVSGGMAAPTFVLGKTRGEPYPEVTGYLIPTLLKWGQRDLAAAFADWLLSIQFQSGAFPRPGGVPAVFDTAQVIRGLRAMCTPKCQDAADRAENWVARQPLEELAQANVYHILTGAVIGIRPSVQVSVDLATSGVFWTRPTRTHYIAYAIEGMRGLDMDVRLALVRARKAKRYLGLYAYQYDRHWEAKDAEPCVCASAQMAMLLKDAELLSAVTETQNPHTGGFPARPGGRECIPWAAKYYLDACLAIGDEAAVDRADPPDPAEPKEEAPDDENKQDVRGVAVAGTQTEGTAE